MDGAIQSLFPETIIAITTAFYATILIIRIITWWAGMRILLFPSRPITIRVSRLISESLSHHKFIPPLSAFSTAV